MGKLSWVNDLAKGAAKNLDEVAQAAAKQLDMSKAGDDARIAARKTLVNNKGLPVHSTVEGQQNFAKWFGESGVVDGQRNPIVVYHGTDSDTPIDSFRPGKDGIWFAEEAAVSRQFGEPEEYYLSSDNHLDMVDPKNRSIVDEIERENFDAGELVDNDGNPESLYELVKWGNLSFNGRDAQTKVINAVKRRGYSGLKFADFHQDAQDIVHVVFKPEQIKSATSNSGAFNPKNPNITGYVDPRLLAPIAAGAGALMAAQAYDFGTPDYDAKIRDFSNRRAAKAPFWDNLKRLGPIGESLDIVGNLAAGLVAPMAEAPHTLRDYVAGVPAEEMTARREQRRAQADYTPRTEAGQAVEDATWSTIGAGLLPLLHVGAEITRPLHKPVKAVWDAIGPREKMALEAGLDLIP